MYRHMLTGESAFIQKHTHTLTHTESLTYKLWYHWLSPVSESVSHLFDPDLLSALEYEAYLT